MIQEVLQFDKSHHLDLNFSIQNASFLPSPIRSRFQKYLKSNSNLSYCFVLGALC